MPLSFPRKFQGLPPEPLITMDTLEDKTSDVEYYPQNITSPSAVASRSQGSAIKTSIAHGEPVHISLDWWEALPHPNYRVAYKLRTKSNDECGSKYDAQIQFLKRFKGAAQILEKEATLASLPTTSPGIVLKRF
ncbi:hypothetical protein Bca52824_064672 [Brassica carinata]|uniref:Vacuolar sorting receptor thioredoxin-like domain-containing protein n=4 Tax=Brassica TaxID=3705 RepID=A0A8S9S6A7_BRACR|nr:hypothetical protein F2Q69_00028742 [Brassica cretica]KAG2270117.1 hypothetical protein Bca52824_064672 [Brassica carinata]